jgi:hypothetical protein
MEIGCMARRITWNGSSDEAVALLHALAAHCDCRHQSGKVVRPCAPHLMLTYDQRAVDGLVFVRRIAGRLISEEFELVDAEVTSRNRA